MLLFEVLFLASLMVADEQNFMERAYLDELAKQLRLEPSLKAQLERQLAQPQPPATTSSAPMSWMNAYRREPSVLRHRTRPVNPGLIL